MVTIMRPSMTEKLKMRRSVERTVEKLRFSRVRKYFWLRLMVLSWPDSLKMDSSSAEVCSGDVPFLDGSCARASFSTCVLASAHPSPQRNSGRRTAISKSTNLSANVDISLLKQKRYSPASWAEKTKSPWRSFAPSMMIFSLGPVTA